MPVQRKREIKVYEDVLKVASEWERERVGSIKLLLDVRTRGN